LANQRRRRRHTGHSWDAHPALGRRCAREQPSYAGARTATCIAVARRQRKISITFIARRPVNCTPVAADQYGRTVATCSVAGADIGEWLVHNGLALDWPQYSKGKYGSAQREADRSGRGVWAGSYVEPWLFRGCIRAGWYSD